MRAIYIHLALSKDTSISRLLHFTYSFLCLSRRPDVTGLTFLPDELIILDKFVFLVSKRTSFENNVNVDIIFIHRTRSYAQYNLNVDVGYILHF